MTRYAAALATTTAALLLAAAPAAPASAATTVADWQMNEDSGSTMRDSTGRHPGDIGADVRLLGSAYRFPFIERDAYRPQHIVTVPNAPALNPGTGAWSVTARMKFTQNFGNVLQKGQGGNGRTYMKMQAPKGIVSCLFRGADGSVSVNSGVPLNDGSYHVVTCRREGKDVTMTIDGTRTRTASGATGAISNTLPFAIGGKSQCNGDTVTCDYWVGDMDYVKITSG